MFFTFIHSIMEIFYVLTGHIDMTEILLKAVLNTNQSIKTKLDDTEG